MVRIDFVALQQRLTQQQPKPATTVPAEPPSWSTRPTSALRTTPTERPAAAPAVASTGTLRATTTMRAALPLKGTTLRAERAEERARANALQVQIDELNAALVVANSEADRLKEQLEALSAEIVRAEQEAAGAKTRADRAEAAVAGERSQADVLRDRVDGLQHDLLASQTLASDLVAGWALTTDIHARELTVAQRGALEAQQAAAELRQADVARKSMSLVARLRMAWRGE